MVALVSHEIQGGHSSDLILHVSVWPTPVKNSTQLQRKGKSIGQSLVRLKRNQFYSQGAISLAGQSQEKTSRELGLVKK